MNHNITVEGGSSVRLPTAGKYCDRDIIVTATGGGAEVILQGKAVTPTKSQQNLTADEGYTALGEVIVYPIPDEYIVPSGTLDITENGTHDAKDYESVSVNVPIPEGYIKPSGTKNITENGTQDVTEYASVTVSVPSKEPVLQEKTVTENGEVLPDSGYDGLSKVTVNVPTGGGGGGELPEGYRRCDYILFSGTQWVDTGYKGTQNTQIATSFTWENSTQRQLFGCASSDNTASVTAYMNGSWRFGAKSTSKSIGVKNSMLPYSVLVNKTTISVSGSATSLSGVANFETVGTLLLGGARDADGTEPSVGIYARVFYFYLWNGSDLVRKLVPVTDGSVYRFYDYVSGDFFDSITKTPLGGGNF